MKHALLAIKVVHTLIFWVLSGCVVYVLISGITGNITVWTWIATVLLFLEGVALAFFAWRCPLTILAERHGAASGSVADLFLPKWAADQLFPVCGTTYALSLLIVVCRTLQGWLGLVAFVAIGMVGCVVACRRNR